MRADRPIYVKQEIVMDRPRESRSGSDIRSLSENSLCNCAESRNKRRGESSVLCVRDLREKEIETHREEGGESCSCERSFDITSFLSFFFFWSNRKFLRCTQLKYSLVKA